jgi:hypothetical protein
MVGNRSPSGFDEYGVLTDEIKKKAEHIGLLMLSAHHAVMGTF